MSLSYIPVPLVLTKATALFGFEMIIAVCNIDGVSGKYIGGGGGGGGVGPRGWTPPLGMDYE